MKVAGVSVSMKSLPSKEQLIEQALKGRDYYQKKDAKKLIEAEIKASGLFKASTKRVSKPKSKSTKGNSRRNNNKQS